MSEMLKRLTKKKLIGMGAIVLVVLLALGFVKNMLSNVMGQM